MLKLKLYKTPEYYEYRINIKSKAALIVIFVLICAGAVDYLFFSENGSLPFMYVFFILVALAGILYNEKYRFSRNSVEIRTGLHPFFIKKIITASEISHIEYNTGRSGPDKNRIAFLFKYTTNLFTSLHIVLNNGRRIFLDSSKKSGSDSLKKSAEDICTFSGLKLVNGKDE